MTSSLKGNEALKYGSTSTIASTRSSPMPIALCGVNSCIGSIGLLSQSLNGISRHTARQSYTSACHNNHDGIQLHTMHRFSIFQSATTITMTSSCILCIDSAFASSSILHHLPAALEHTKLKPRREGECVTIWSWLWLRFDWPGLSIS